MIEIICQELRSGENIRLEMKSLIKYLLIDFQQCILQDAFNCTSSHSSQKIIWHDMNEQLLHILVSLTKYSSADLFLSVLLFCGFDNNIQQLTEFLFENSLANYHLLTFICTHILVKDLNNIVHSLTCLYKIVIQLSLSLILFCFWLFVYELENLVECFETVTLYNKDLIWR